MPEKEIQNVYFIGIGGIGMSAIARFYKTKGKRVCGYDRTPTPLTSSLQDEGIAVHFTEDVKEIPEIFKEEIEHTLVIYTPAIPADHSELQYFRNNGYKLIKRSQALGFLTKGQKTVAVAGTHGKTTTSTLIAHILKQSELGCNAFLGGFSKNYQTNLLLYAGSPFVVTEADEFDRYFLQ
ncbi:MAG: Mur ligase domain-containing protein, partial [Bacteroidota bacterium]|nr:Mur ligase domain-containing protein [Bacteroidota bacterium]